MIDYHALFSSLNDAIGILNEHRSPDPDFVAALDALKQARARIARVMSQPVAPAGSRDYAAA